MKNGLLCLVALLFPLCAAAQMVHPDYVDGKIFVKGPLQGAKWEVLKSAYGGGAAKILLNDGPAGDIGFGRYGPSILWDHFE